MINLKIIFVRHGQTNLNINNKNIIKKMQGQSDLELNDIGKSQAVKVREKIKEKDVDIILVSPLKRAQQTAKIINEINLVLYLFLFLFAQNFDFAQCYLAFI